jgi:hypothetical protein
MRVRWDLCMPLFRWLTTGSRVVVPGWALESDEHDDNNNRGVGAMMHQSETRQSLVVPVS